ncbi:MAG: hypothetical protein Q9174_004597 [Haloplaca sp. 1 TL-2023]
MAISISSSTVACLKAFNALVGYLQHLDQKGSAGLLITPWQDELGRLRMWAANIGAHQINQWSLDYRLRDSSHVHLQIINLLENLLKRLQEAGNAISEDEDPESDEVESLGGSSSDDDNPRPNVYPLQKSVATIITCLFQMSMLVRKPAQHDLRVTSKGIDVAAFEPFDYNHVRDKYPKAEDFIVSRLGHGITQRRKYLKYRERHALKMKQGIDEAAGNAVNDNASGTVLSDTIATDAQDRNVKFDDRASQSGMSQTSYAPTLMSGGDITIPAPPRDARECAPFECPYCYYVIYASNIQSWNRHVFEDLQPYMCLEKTCSTPQKLYTTKHEWMHHTTTAHPSLSAGERECDEEERDDSGPCVLCGDFQETRQLAHRHVARHLQELALFVLPCNHSEDSDDSEESFDSQVGITRPYPYPKFKTKTKRHEDSDDEEPKAKPDPARRSDSTMSERNSRLESPTPSRGEKETFYPCLHPSCNARFPRAEDLDRHVKTHFSDSENWYDCPKAERCGGERFSRIADLNEHLRKVHGQNISMPYNN